MAAILRAPSPAEDYLETPLDLSEYLIENKAATFMMRVDGDSMKDAGILDGDPLVVDRAAKPVNGSVVIVAVNGAPEARGSLRDAHSYRAFLILIQFGDDGIHTLTMTVGVSIIQIRKTQSEARDTERRVVTDRHHPVLMAEWSRRTQEIQQVRQ
ncbi:LexA family protein [Terriglobus roseus]|uniref:Peptidase S24-like n=1 Tax=Terriglobus roseus TaxID=392734 RepID=A0A1H4K3T1_9BACT|nr:S24 family peptidase [Terriglobus roseus]SEB53229.1 Peptidase S24-like [Terriglobus roseus]